MGLYNIINYHIYSDKNYIHVFSTRFKLIESNLCKNIICVKKSVSLVCVICTIYSSISLVLVSAHEPHTSLLEQLISNAPELLYSVVVSHHSRVVEIIPLDNVKTAHVQCYLGATCCPLSFLGLYPSHEVSQKHPIFCNIRENADQFLNKMAVLQRHISQGFT